jgi:CheY-like chemotaxis protein
MATILIIDDDPQIRGMLREALEMTGHVVVESVNGAEGVERYRSQPADLIICDLVMPEKSGITMIRELVQDFPELKFITMSGFTKSLGFTSLEFTKKLGAQWALPKPFELADMVEAVQKALNQKDPTPVSCS